MERKKGKEGKGQGNEGKEKTREQRKRMERADTGKGNQAKQSGQWSWPMVVDKLGWPRDSEACEARPLEVGVPTAEEELDSYLPTFLCLVTVTVFQTLASFANRVAYM